MKKKFTALAIVLALSLFAISIAFASAPAKSNSIGHQPTAILGQPGKISPASSEATYLAKFDIKNMGLLDSGQTYVLGAKDLAPDFKTAAASMWLYGTSRTRSSAKKASAYIKDMKITAPIIATDVLNGKTFIAKTSRIEQDGDHSAYAEPRGTFRISRATSGTLALL